MLKRLLINEAHALDGSTSLTTQVEDTQSGIAIGKEVVNEQYPVFIRQIFTADSQGIFALLGE